MPSLRPGERRAEIGLEMTHPRQKETPCHLHQCAHLIGYLKMNITCPKCDFVQNDLLSRFLAKYPTKESISLSHSSPTETDYHQNFFG